MQVGLPYFGPRTLDLDQNPYRFDFSFKSVFCLSKSLMGNAEVPTFVDEVSFYIILPYLI